MFLVKCGRSFFSRHHKKNKLVIENQSFFLCKFRGGRQSRPLQNIASFVEVAVAPISGHTSRPHRMHVANDEKMST